MKRMRENIEEAKLKLSQKKIENLAAWIVQKTNYEMPDENTFADLVRNSPMGYQNISNEDFLKVHNLVSTFIEYEDAYGESEEKEEPNLNEDWTEEDEALWMGDNDKETQLALNTRRYDDLKVNAVNFANANREEVGDLAADFFMRKCPSYKMAIEPEDFESSDFWLDIGHFIAKEFFLVTDGLKDVKVGDQDLYAEVALDHIYDEDAGEIGYKIESISATNDVWYYMLEYVMGELANQYSEVHESEKKDDAKRMKEDAIDDMDDEYYDDEGLAAFAMALSNDSRFEYDKAGTMSNQSNTDNYSAEGVDWRVFEKMCADYGLEKGVDYITVDGGITYWFFDDPADYEDYLNGYYDDEDDWDDYIPASCAFTVSLY